MSGKEVALFFLPVCAALAIGFGAGVYYGRDQEQDQQQEERQQSHTSRDTTREIHETQQPSQEKEARPAPRITPEVRYAADSSFTQAKEKGEDTLRALYTAAVAPRETTVVFPGIGELRHRSDRLHGIETYGFNPYPRKDTTYYITDTVFVPDKEPRPASITVSKVSLVGVGAAAGGLFGGPLGAAGGGVGGLIVDWIFFE
jgi:hypothetical protein